MKFFYCYFDRKKKYSFTKRIMSNEQKDYIYLTHDELQCIYSLYILAYPVTLNFMQKNEIDLEKWMNKFQYFNSGEELNSECDNEIE